MLEVSLGNVRPEEKTNGNRFDVIVIGAGPSGLTSALYASRSRLSTLLLEKIGSGGQLAITADIENYPGFPDGINGFELAQKMEEQAKRFGAKFEYGEATALRKAADGKDFEIVTEDKNFQARSVIISTGASPRRLGVPGEAEFVGRGISFCATCDAAFYKEKTVAVIGGGDSALDEGLYLTKFAKKVYIIHRRNALRAEKILQERAFAHPRIEFIWDTVVENVNGDNKIRSISLKNVKTAAMSELSVDGMFLYIGLDPNTDIVKGLVNLAPGGYVITDAMMRTNVPGILACGDVRDTPLRQVTTAVGDGAIAAHYAEKYLES
jgi:thioredoxin reductase (NADPH)